MRIKLEPYRRKREAHSHASSPLHLALLSPDSDIVPDCEKPDILAKFGASLLRGEAEVEGITSVGHDDDEGS